MQDILQTCRISGSQFIIDTKDQAYYKKIGVPLPTLCPNERQRRRMSWRNETSLYHRKCDLCNKQIISIYHAGSPYTVYCNDCWWSDKWDPMNYGQEFDFSRSFFEQMHELQLKVPRLALFQKNNLNSDFTNHTENIKNCYLCTDTANSQDIYYSKWVTNCQDLTDCAHIDQSQLCIEVQYQEKGYMNIYNFFSDFSIESAFIYNCTNCTHCFMCTNLQRKKYCIRNKQFTKEEYEKFMSEINLGSHEQLTKCKQEYHEMIAKAHKRANLQTLCEDCEGDCMYKSKSVKDSYDIFESWDCRYCYESGNLKDCYDVYESAFNCELQYECHGNNRGQFLKFGHVAYDMDNSDYVDTCHNSSYLFGCVSLRRKQYCILNKQYSEEDYRAIREKIIEHMKMPLQGKSHASAQPEWGEFFPTKYSPFAYNETMASLYFPTSKEDVLRMGWHWKEDDEVSAYQGDPYQLPDNIKDTPDEVCKKILKCEVSGKFYKIIPQELSLYRKLNMALPRRAPHQRHMDRLGIRNPWGLWEQSCGNCQKNIRAPYLPGTHIVYCEECFIQMKYT